MKSRLTGLAASLIAAFGATAGELPKSAGTPTASGPQVTGLFRIVRPDGATVIQQAPLSTAGGSSVYIINVSTADAFFAGGGMCAFNVKYDEISASAATNTTNRLYSNDRLIAQNTKIDLTANVLKTIWTQPYLTPGQNNVKVMVNADAGSPSVGWVRVNVSGTCGAAPAPTVQKIVSGSAEWNNLYNAWGYSNYAVTQLKGKGYARYGDLVKLNSDLTAVVNAKTVDKPAYDPLMARWNSLANDPAFKQAMASITPPKPGVK